MSLRRIVQHTGAIVVAGAAVSIVAAGGCADTEATFHVRSVASFDESCVCSPESALLSAGTFDAGFAADYELCLVVQNRLQRLEDYTKPRAESNWVEIYAVDVTVEGEGVTGGPSCPTSFSYPAKGFAEPESAGSVISLGIPQCLAGQVRESLAVGETRTVVINFVVHGHTTGGDEIETPEYSFPVEIGNFSYCTGADIEEGAAIPCTAGANGPVPRNLCPG